MPKTLRLNVTHHFIMKTPNRRELQHIKLFADVELKYLMKLYKDYCKKPCSFLVNNTTLSSGNPLRSRKSLL